jgi:hypothetical protein
VERGGTPPAEMKRREILLENLFSKEDANKTDRDVAAAFSEQRRRSLATYIRNSSGALALFREKFKDP